MIDRVRSPRGLESDTSGGNICSSGGRGRRPVAHPCPSEDMPDWLWSLNLTFVVSKLYEGLDTAFIVWFKTDSSKKDLSFLRPVGDTCSECRSVFSHVGQ